MTPQEYSNYRSEVAIRSNKARGITEKVQKEVLHLYLQEDKSAKEVAAQLGISRGAVRGTINRAYASMSVAERDAWKRRHGSRARQGDRNPNYRSGQAHSVGS